jgi:hypothetical protein
MAEDSTPRVMFKQIGGTSVVTTYTGSTWTSSVVGNGWEEVEVAFAPGSLGGAAFRTYIDLAGYTREDLTTFIQGIDIQKQNSPLDNTGNVNVVWEFDFITSRRLTISELSNFESQPGFLPSTLDLQELIYAEKRTYQANTTIPGAYIITNNETSGSGNATAADRLHWTRLYIFGTAATNTCQILPANLVVTGMTAKEKDLVYIERLRRSYTQQRSEP